MQSLLLLNLKKPFIADTEVLMKNFKFRKGLAAICLALLLSLLLLTHAFADVHYGKDPHNGFEGYFDTGCNHCGQDNPQWLEEDTVHYCSNCGALGFPSLVDEDEPDAEFKPDPEPDDYDDWDDEDDEEIPFEVVIGGGVIIGGAAVIIIRNARKKKAAKKSKKPSSREKQKQDREQPVGYILNLSHNNVAITPQTPAQITITVLRVYADQRTQIEPSAPITVSTNPDSDIQVLPPNGFGQILLSIYQKDSDPKSAEEFINIIATVPGAQKTAQIKVNLTPRARVVFF